LSLLFACFLFGAIAANAQIRVHSGLTAGVPITDTLVSTSSSSSNGQGYSFSRFNCETKRLLIGPSLRIDLVKGLGLEFDALYQRVNYDSSNINTLPELSNVYRSFEAVHANRWQFPLLVQYTFAVHSMRTFIEAGPAISTIGNSKGTFSSTTSNNFTNSSTSNSVSGGRYTTAGITAGGGVDLPVLHAHLRPEFRYSHWFRSTGVSERSGNFGFANFLVSSVGSTPFNIEQNELSFLLSLSF